MVKPRDLLGALILAALLLLPLYVAGQMHDDAMRACEVHHSAETCLATLKP